ncbi:MAG: DUF5320 domain-containing protein [Candidatus Hydrogenedentes bacterium]|nr:DUF5320 domain-containing protein [Candidatus Hydrogenedentota bacterium]
MPGGDGTGPLGMGPRTGRAAGYCVGAGVAGCANPGTRLGFRGGRGGRGRGWRHWSDTGGRPGWGRRQMYPLTRSVPDADFEKEVLKDQYAALKAEMERIEQRLNDLEPVSHG